MLESPPDLSKVLTSTPLGGGRFSLMVPDGWQQGRGAFGGFSLGALARAVLDSEPEAERTVRSLTAALTGPVLVGEAEITVTLLRRGTGVSTFTAALRQPAQSGDEVLAHATVVLGRRRNLGKEFADHRLQPTAPAALAGALDEVPEMPFIPGLMPNFTQHFVIRSATPPFVGGSSVVTEGLVAPRRPVASLDAPELLALTDVYWPAFFALETQPRPGGTLSFTEQVFPPRAPLPLDQPLYCRAVLLAAQDGYLYEQRELWSADGQLLVLSPQTFAVVR